MINILCVIGTRPEAIKMAPVIKELERYPNKVQAKVCVTAQHRDMLDQALHVFGIIPDFDLNIMSPGQSLARIASDVLTGLQRILTEQKYDWILVQGDTTTVLAAALAAVYCDVRVGHIEAGLRTFNRKHPFPEEINRRLLGAIADRHYSPTDKAQQNLINENISADQILVTGNTVVDALNMALEISYDLSKGPLSEIPFGQKKIILVTAHRRESFGERLEEICKAVLELAERYENVIHFVWPVHPNPNAKRLVQKYLLNSENISLVPPLNYVDFCQLMKRCYLILTDSGGMQEEAPSLGIPVLILREVTERQEVIEAGLAKLVGFSKSNIVLWASRLIEDSEYYSAMARRVNLFGDGRAAEKIVFDLLKYEPADQQ